MFFEKYMGENKNNISPIKNPFENDKVENITFHMLKSYITKDFYWFGIVKFQNGNTKGEFRTQDYSANQFNDCVSEIHNLLKNI